MKKLILSWLLHHANRYHKDEHFYTIKRKILDKYGVVTDYHYQKIEGKKCWTCYGTGIWTGYSWYNNRQYSDTCNKCGGDGWYINPSWNVLAVVKIGKYTFHKPIERSYKKPAPGSHVFEGYIAHEPSKYSWLCRMILFLLYDRKGYRKNWHTGIGNAWYKNKHWHPVQIARNLAHIIRYGRDSYPFRMRRYRKMQKNRAPAPEMAWDGEDLPF
jgi:hypothetical protein